MNSSMRTTNRTLLATFGSGCFWCTETLFRELRGVVRVTSGYAGGTVERPTYEQVCSGRTGHAEVVQVEFDPALVSYEQLLEAFFLSHDPTQRNRQGHDVGPQYRSVIFAHDDEQRTTAERVRQRLSDARIFNEPIVTTTEQFTAFYPAELEHQNYFANNPSRGYCQVVINPKLITFRRRFATLLKRADSPVTPSRRS